MKLVIAVVRPDRLGAVLEELFRSEVQGLTISRVQGHGGEREHVETYRGTTVKMELSEKVRLEIGVSNHFVEPTVQAILRGARTGRCRRRQDLRRAGREGLPDSHGRRGSGRGDAGDGRRLIRPNSCPSRRARQGAGVREQETWASASRFGTVPCTSPGQGGSSCAMTRPRRCYRGRGSWPVR